MPITVERLNDLLVEHEQCLALVRQTKQMIEDVMRVAEYDKEQTKAQAFALVRNFLDDLAKVPDALAKIERQHYRSTIRRTLKVRKRMEMLRRRNGVPERLPPSDIPAEVMADIMADQEYRRRNNAVNMPFGADGRPMIDPDPVARVAAAVTPKKKRSVIYDPEQATDAETEAEFDATLGKSEVVLTPDEIVGQINAAQVKALTARPGLSPIEHELTKKFTSK